MDRLTFINEMTKALAWPTVSLVILVILRKPFSNILPLLTRLRYGAVEMEFNREISRISEKITPEAGVASKEELQIKEKLISSAIVDPKVAVISAWRHVENRLVDLAQHHSLDIAPGAWTRPLILSFFLLDKGLITLSQDEAIKRIKVLRDQAANAVNIQLSEDEAVNYIDVAMQLAASIGHPDKQDKLNKQARTA